MSESKVDISRDILLSFGKGLSLVALIEFRLVSSLGKEHFQHTQENQDSRGAASQEARVCVRAKGMQKLAQGHCPRIKVTAEQLGMGRKWTVSSAEVVGGRGC